jgi:DNA-directed RNA polymerase specialized sigma24 family protein
MRHVLVDYARARRQAKRGASALHIPVESAVVLSSEQVEQIVAVWIWLYSAWRKPTSARAGFSVFEMRFFGGLSVEETAEVLGVSPNTVIRDWDFARAWLRRELGGAGTANCGTMAAD